MPLSKQYESPGQHFVRGLETYEVGPRAPPGHPVPRQPVMSALEHTLVQGRERPALEIDHRELHVGLQRENEIESSLPTRRIRADDQRQGAGRGIGGGEDRTEDAGGSGGG